MTPPRGTDGGTDQIACGAKSCDSATQVCCVGGGGGAAAGQACTTAAACKGQALACSGSNSCASGDVCCAEPAARGGGVTSKCETKCPMGSQQLCTTNTDCTADEVCRRLSAEVSVCERAPTPPTRDGGIVIGRRDGGP